MTYKLPEGWKEFKLGDVVEVNPRETLKKETLCKKIGMADLTEYQRKISSYEYDYYKGGTKFRNKDTLFSRITPCLENGKIAYVDILDQGELAFGSTEFLVLREKAEISNSKYIFYLSLSPTVKELAIKSMVGSSGRQRVQNDVFKNIRIPLPHLKEQEAIANTLSVLDDKIENNNKIAKNLEEQAQAIFKHWFVDFEFPNEEGKPYKSSGGEMVESELGMIPKGWDVGKLGDSKLGKLMSSGIDSFKGEKIYLATADVINTSINNNETLITMEDKPSRANMQPKSNTVWFAKMKDSRKLIFVEKNDNVLKDKYIFSTGFAGIQGSETSVYYLWTYIQSDNFNNLKDNLCIGTTMQAINNRNINKIKLVIPDSKMLEKFNEIVRPLYNKVNSNRNENKMLVELRDALLPKLISGEIRVLQDTNGDALDD